MIMSSTFFPEANEGGNKIWNKTKRIDAVLNNRLFTKKSNGPKCDVSFYLNF